MVVTVMKYFYLLVAIFCLAIGVMAGFMQELPLSVLIGTLSFINFGLYFVFHREALKKQHTHR